MSRVISIPKSSRKQANFSSQAIEWLEQGNVLYLPDVPFPIGSGEQVFLSEKYTHPKSKNISYDIPTDKVVGVADDLAHETAEMEALRAMLARFSKFSTDLLADLTGEYAQRFRRGRASFRPVEIEGRASGVKKNDTLLHVDTFVLNPPQGERLFRVFTNVSPHGKNRVWRVGEPFPHLAERFLPKLRRPIPGSGWLLYSLRLTKKVRTPYDHYMMHLHDTMKGDAEYQRTAPQSRFEFPPGSTWICFTDAVSHAALSGQHMFEQTMFLPVKQMVNPAHSPLRHLERLTGRTLARAA